MFEIERAGKPWLYIGKIPGNKRNVFGFYVKPNCLDIVARGITDEDACKLAKIIEVLAEQQAATATEGKVYKIKCAQLQEELTCRSREIIRLNQKVAELEGLPGRLSRQEAESLGRCMIKVEGHWTQGTFFESAGGWSTPWSLRIVHPTAYAREPE